MALLDIQDFIEEFAHMEAKAHAVVFCNFIRILSGKQPAAFRCAEFQLVTVILSLFGGECRSYFRYAQVADSHQLVFNLLALGLKLDFVREMLPSAPAADAEMAAEWLQSVFRRRDELFNAAFHVVFLLLENADVHDVTGNGVVYEYDHSVYMSEAFAFGCDFFDLYVLQKEVNSFP